MGGSFAGRLRLNYCIFGVNFVGLGSCWVVEFVCVCVCVCVCVFKFLGYIVWLQSCSFCACFFVALLACFFSFCNFCGFCGFLRV